MIEMSNKDALVGISKIIGRIKSKFYSIEEPDKLLEFINDNIKPTTENKKSRGEVFTPMELVNEMLDKLPKDVWTNPDLKWLDPAAGMGNFPIAVYLHLFKSLKPFEPNDEKRRKHILEKMLYMVEIDKYNVFMIKKILCGHKYKLNIFEGSFIEGEKYPKVYKTDLKFDVIMGNPPFQNTDIDGNRRALLNNLWSLFIDKSFNKLLKNNGFLVYITPISWMSNGFKYKDVFYKNYILYLNINECNKWFNVGSQFSYYIIKKTTTKQLTESICNYKSKNYKSSFIIPNTFSYLPKLLTKESLTIINKFYNNKIKKISFNSSSVLHHFFKKKLIGLCDKKFIYPIRHTKTHNNLCSSIKHPLANKNKILLNISGNLDPLYDNGKIGITEAQMYFITNNKQYIKILNSNLFKFVFDICKWSGFNILSMFKNIPYIEKYTTNENIYKIFKLTKLEIAIIEEHIKI